MLAVLAILDQGCKVGTLNLSIVGRQSLFAMVAYTEQTLTGKYLWQKVQWKVCRL